MADLALLIHDSLKQVLQSKGLIIVPKDGDEWPCEAYVAFWKAYEECPEGEGRWNAWAAGLTAMFKTIK